MQHHSRQSSGLISNLGSSRHHPALQLPLKQLAETPRDPITSKAVSTKQELQSWQGVCTCMCFTSPARPSGLLLLLFQILVPQGLTFRPCHILLACPHRPKHQIICPHILKVMFNNNYKESCSTLSPAILFQSIILVLQLFIKQGAMV